MQQGEFEMLVQAGAALQVDLGTHPDGGWLVCVSFPATENKGAVIETARGGIRVWKNLDTAQQWIRARGWNGDVRILGR